MTGGLIQLVARGIEDIYLINEPQITFFKIVYRRHTNFTREQTPQYFDTKNPSFGQKITCVVGKYGDLITDATIIMTLPKINPFVNGLVADTLTKFAWVRKIGFAIIKTVNIEIGGQLIDRQYGEWLNIISELIGPKDKNIDKLIGNISTLTGFTNGKDEYTIGIPLKFWFCGFNGLALPLVALQFSEVKITVELNDLQNCYLISPTHYIDTESDLSGLQPYEYIEQNVNGVIATGMFINFDPTIKRLYFIKISDNSFQTITNANSSTLTPIQRVDYVFGVNTTTDTNVNDIYYIYGLTSGHYVMPVMNGSIKTYAYTKIKTNIKLKNCYVMIDYIYLEPDERNQFVKARHDYLIEQVNYNGPFTISSSNSTLALSLSNPCKYIVWLTQLAYLQENTNNDWFNYTDSYQYGRDGKQLGKSLVVSETLVLNTVDRVSKRNNKYFNCIQAYQNFNYSAPEGFNIYSFALLPCQLQPSGSCNMSQITTIQATMNLSHILNINNPAVFNAYAVNYNILRISDGLAGLIFS